MKGTGRETLGMVLHHSPTVTVCDFIKVDMIFVAVIRFSILYLAEKFSKLTKFVLFHANRNHKQN